VIVTFQTALSPTLSLEDTMIFDETYERKLNFGPKAKARSLRNGIAAWLFVDGALAGETYGAPLGESDDEVAEDDDDEDADDELGADVETGDADLVPYLGAAGVIYCDSTTILPAFQKQGLSYVLCAFWLGMVKQAGYRVVIGHASLPEMMNVKAYFGARELAVRPKWYGTDRDGRFYELVL
jgi:GNAT superfamily N-acetyltransferase